MRWSLALAAALAADSAVLAGPWWDSHWRYRAPCPVAAPHACALSAQISFSRLLWRAGGGRQAFDINSIRVIEHGPDGAPLAGPLPCAFEKADPYSATHNATGVLTWRIPERPGDGKRLFCVYFDTEDNGPKPSLPPPDPPPTPNLLPNGDFETRPESNPPWKVERGAETRFYAVWSATAARSGAHSMRAETDRGSNCMTTTPLVPAQSGQALRMSIWYRVDSAGAGAVTPCVSFLCAVKDEKTGRTTLTKMTTDHAPSRAQPGDWVQVEKTVAPPPGSLGVALRYGIWNSHGAAWFDDAVIRPAVFDEITEMETLDATPEP